MVGWRLSAASDISDDGRVIVGYGRAPSGRLEGFAVVIPEPGMIFLFIAGVAVIMIGKRLRRVRQWSPALTCLGIALASNYAGAAVFYPLGPGQANAVSPNGALTLTNSQVWTPTGGFLDYLPNQTTFSRDISNNGFVVGLIDGSYIAFRTPAGGPIQELGTLPGGNFGSDANGITPDGNVVVGYSSSPTGPQAFRWTSATGMMGLGHLGPGDHFADAAHGISADGSVVVGESEAP